MSKPSSNSTPVSRAPDASLVTEVKAGVDSIFIIGKIIQSVALLVLGGCVGFLIARL